MPSNFIKITFFDICFHLFQLRNSSSEVWNLYLTLPFCNFMTPNLLLLLTHNWLHNITSMDVLLETGRGVVAAKWPWPWLCVNGNPNFRFLWWAVYSNITLTKLLNGDHKSNSDKIGNELLWWKWCLLINLYMNKRLRNFNVNVWVFSSTLKCFW